MSYTPTVRKPTGIPAAPLIMVSGLPKTGKSLTAYKVGLHPMIGRVWAIDMGEGSADEYAQAGPYEVVDWGNSWSDLKDTIRWCLAQPVEDGKLNAVILDSGTEVWEGIKDRAAKRAANSKRSREALAKDPDYEVDVSMPFWNDAKATWAAIVNPLRTAGHIVGIILARTEEVAEVRNGVPVPGRTITSVKVEKSLPAMVTAHVEMDQRYTARLKEVRSLNVSIPNGGLVLDAVNPLGDLLTRMLGEAAAFAAPVVVQPLDTERITADGVTPDRDDEPAFGIGARIMQALKDAGLTADEKAAVRELAASHNVKELVASALDRNDRAAAAINAWLDARTPATTGPVAEVPADTGEVAA